VQAKYRIGQSRFWIGLGYALATTQVEFDAPAATPGLPPFQSDSRVGRFDAIAHLRFARQYVHSPRVAPMSSYHRVCLARPWGATSNFSS
jgi:hypothetical protein